MANSFEGGRFARFRSRVLLDPLPDDFLRLHTGQEQGARDHELRATPTNCQGRLEVTVDQASLTKNYGVTRMDPYCRLRIGNYVLETPTDLNGARRPVWNHRVDFDLPIGMRLLNVEVLDERPFRKEDQVIGWCKVNLPDELLEEQAVIDDWYSLSGRQGDCGEGQIHLVLHFESFRAGFESPGSSLQLNVAAQSMSSRHGPAAAPEHSVAHAESAPTGGLSQPAPDPERQESAGREETYRRSLATLAEMFPNMDHEVVQSVLYSCHGNTDLALSNLLEMAAH